MSGSTLTGMYEESVGYRYFYTLRSLYEGSYLFLPQGELVNLLFKGIHVALTTAGYPITQLYPRIDYFTYAGVTVMHLITAACFWWGTAPIRRPIAKFSAALFWGALYYVPQTSAVYALLQPDYYVLFPALSLLTNGAILRIQHRFEWSGGVVGSFALFVGAALSVKLSLAILPCIALLHAVIMSRRPAIGLASSALAGLLGTGVWLCILFVEMGADLSYVSRHIGDLLKFLSNPGMSNDLPWKEWITLRVSQSPPLAVAIYVMPLLAGLSFLAARKRWELTAVFSFLVGTMAFCLFLFNRDYANTILEGVFLLAALLTVVSQFRIFSPLSGLNWLLIPALFYSITWFYPKGVGSLIGSAKLNTEEQITLGHIEEGIRGGPLLWLVESNHERPLSVDSAIMKGGYAYSSRWLDPPSKIMSSMFSNRDFRFGQDRSLPLYLEDYGAVMFVYQGDIEQKKRHLADVYAISLLTWSCKPATTVSSYTIAICDRPR
jgi:hypothetical protein